MCSVITFCCVYQSKLNRLSVCCHYSWKGSFPLNPTFLDLLVKRLARSIVFSLLRLASKATSRDSLTKNLFSFAFLFVFQQWCTFFLTELMYLRKFLFAWKPIVLLISSKMISPSRVPGDILPGEILNILDLKNAILVALAKPLHYHRFRHYNTKFPALSSISFSHCAPTD